MLEIKFSGSPKEVRDQIRDFALSCCGVGGCVATEMPEPPTVASVPVETPVVQTATEEPVNQTPEPPETKIIKLRAALAELVSAGHKATDLQKWLKDTFDAEKAVDVAHDRLDEAIEAVKAMSL